MKKPLRIALYTVPLLLFVGLAVLLGSRLGTDPGVLPSARLGQPMPAFSLSSLTEPDRLLSAEDFKGHVTVLNVWATWCISCQVEHPVLMEMARQGVRIVGVNYKDIREAAVKYLELHGNPFQFTVVDDSGNLGIDLGVYGAPETYLLDREGNIRYRLVGVLDLQKWETDLKPRFEALQAGKALPEETE
ncbi:MAG: DsbE family thiol:disulfide interchange protein [Moraxellaceae bacterium]|jgi:cytochrome c biogenesis protein CcmG/thiol:disulfide interchange protein DsbE|nr:DsbE family thiol:disulfide interchange protein [Moraxellaceae bacterium]MBP7229227.1 DsbE family thiol:disulfide interchange protein [Moraxellaceae bacterium]MBP8852324.1 DsbE family thiol:disulfide interchange protein [Moraxellaceae bacterium]MBP9045026.1 DsbE family thiol:disulfide interchange protein [Moraxellaceae bacterium]MBP9730057.1 DsbE family thiol:disulfide interchange protein [Moraxellaceae bacterium]